jgi:hypothetical protein
MHLIGRCLLLFLAHPVCGKRLLQDDHPNCSYRFEAEAKDRPATITEAIAVLCANEWAARFYDDPFLQFKAIEWHIKPTRFWLITFIHSDSGKEFCAVVLPDGGIFEPTLENRS